MPLNLTVSFLTIDWSEEIREEIRLALDDGEEVLVVGEVHVIGGPNADLHSDQMPMHDNPPHSTGFEITADVEDASSVQVRVRVEAGDPPRNLAEEIIRDLPAPWFAQRRDLAAAGHPIDGSTTYELAWQASPDILENEPLETGPFPAARNLTTTAVSRRPPDCWQYNPVGLNNLVVDRHEFRAPVASFENWQGWNTRFNDRRGPLPSVAHRPKHPIGGRGTICRNRDDITAIVVHEIGGWVEAFTSVPSHWRGTSTAAHFILQSNGALAQLYDCVQRTTHADRRNRHSVGIECSGRTWTSLATTEQFTPPSRVNNRDPRTIVEGWTLGSSGSNIIVPPLEQLEALHDLISELLIALPNVPATFPSLTLHGEPHAPDDDRRLFLMTHDKPRFNDDGENVPGIYSHANIGGGTTHSDGAFQTLYLWLRMRADVSTFAGATVSERALQAAIDLANNHGLRLRCSDRRTRYFIDVTSVHP